MAYYPFNGNANDEGSNGNDGSVLGATLTQDMFGNANGAYYFAGVKTHNSISTNWDFDFYGTIGTGGSDLPWTVQGMFGRRFSNGNRLGLGVRVWGIDYAEGEGLAGQYTTLDTTFYGLMIGYEFN